MSSNQSLEDVERRAGSLNSINDLKELNALADQADKLEGEREREGPIASRIEQKMSDIINQVIDTLFPEEGINQCFVDGFGKIHDVVIEFLDNPGGFLSGTRIEVAFIIPGDFLYPTIDATEGRLDILPEIELIRSVEKKGVEKILMATLCSKEK